jgi:CO/xanthine dehydrogenase FAD-binding subunit
VVERVPLLLRKIIGLMASPQVRNLATLPGNLAWGSPAADSAPPLLVLDAQLKVIGPKGEKTLDLDGFFLGPGQTRLGPDEVITEIFIPDASLSKSGDSYKFMKRKANTLSVCSAAVSFDRSNGKAVKNVRIAVGAVAPMPLRVKRAEELLEGQVVNDELLNKVKDVVASAITPITDVRSTAWYRKEVTPVLVERCIREALA